MQDLKSQKDSQQKKKKDQLPNLIQTTITFQPKSNQNTTSLMSLSNNTSIKSNRNRKIRTFTPNLSNDNNNNNNQQRGNPFINRHFASSFSVNDNIKQQQDKPFINPHSSSSFSVNDNVNDNVKQQRGKPSINPHSSSSFSVNDNVNDNIKQQQGKQFNNPHFSSLFPLNKNCNKNLQSMKIDDFPSSFGSNNQHNKNSKSCPSITRNDNSNNLGTKPFHCSHLTSILSTSSSKEKCDNNNDLPQTQHFIDSSHLSSLLSTSDDGDIDDISSQENEDSAHLTSLLSNISKVLLCLHFKYIVSLTT